MKKIILFILCLNFTLSAFTQNGRNGPSLWDEIRINSKLDYDNTKPQIIESLKKYDSHQYLINRLSKNGQRYLFYTVSEALNRELPV